MTAVAKKWTVAKQFQGEVKVSDFKLIEENVSTELKAGEILIEALYIGVDPYMRMWPVDTGSTMIGEQVARVKDSKNPAFPKGSLVLSYVGWRTLTVVSEPDKIEGGYSYQAKKIPDLGDLSPSLALGILGMTGLTAYFGLLERGQPKAGQTILVSGAAGAVGSAVGQIAKIKGLTVIGSAGSKEKCDWLKSLGFDHVFNYKEMTVKEALAKFVPQGLDLFFDNIGGDFSQEVISNHMKVHGRVLVCGAISQYNNTDDRAGRNFVSSLIYKELDILGVSVILYRERFTEGVTQLLQWVQEGKLKYRETVTEGFSKVPEAFISLFKGENTGKAVVKV